MLRNPPTPAEAREQLDTARTEATEAAALIETLAERVRDGDTDVTAEQMAGQRQLAELAQLRVTAAERKLTAAQSADLDARARAVADRIAALVDEDSTAPILDAARTVMTAVQALVSVSEERHATIRDVAVDGVHMNEELGRSSNDPWPSRDRYGFMTQSSPQPHVVAVGEGSATAIPAGRVLGLVLRAALDGPSVRQATEMLGLSGEGLQHHTAAISGLAEALTADPVPQGREG